MTGVQTCALPISFEVLEHVKNEKDWKMPKEWKAHKNVFQESYEGMAKFINKQLTKSK